MTLIEDARHELQGRYRGRDERLARLTAAGAPTGHDELREWLRHELDRETEREGGVFYPHTARVSNGVDDDLPQRSGIGCRISRVRFQAELTDNGETWKVFGGSVGPGYSGHAYVASSLAPTEAEAIDLVRRQLLADGCCLTREAAEARAKQLLDERVDSQRSRRGGRHV